MNKILAIATAGLIATNSQAGEIQKRTTELCGQFLGEQPIKTSCENIPNIARLSNAVAQPPEKNGNTEITKYVDFHGIVVAFRSKTTTK